MNTDIEPKPGKWLLVMGGRKVNLTLLKIIGGLAVVGPVRVIDCGNVYDPYLVGHGTGCGLELYKNIEWLPAYGCFELLSTLESLTLEPIPFVVLDMLRSFSNPFVWHEERRKVLKKCLGHLNRLEKAAGGLVSIRPAKVLDEVESELLEMVKEAANDIYQVLITDNYHTPTIMDLMEIKRTIDIDAG